MSTLTAGVQGDPLRLFFLSFKGFICLKGLIWMVEASDGVQRRSWSPLLPPKRMTPGMDAWMPEQENVEWVGGVITWVQCGSWSNSALVWRCWNVMIKLFMLFSRLFGFLRQHQWHSQCLPSNSSLVRKISKWTELQSCGKQGWLYTSKRKAVLPQPESNMHRKELSVSSKQHESKLTWSSDAS